MTSPDVPLNASRRWRWGSHVRRLIEFRKRFGWRGDTGRLAAIWAVRGAALRDLARGGLQGHRDRLDAELAAASRRVTMHDAELVELSSEKASAKAIETARQTAWTPWIMLAPSILDVAAGIAAPRPGPLLGATC